MVLSDSECVFMCVSRCNSFIGNSAAQKKSLTKPKKPHLCGHKSSSSSSSHEPQPKRVEEVYGALKQGLEYVQIICMLSPTYTMFSHSTLNNTVYIVNMMSSIQYSVVNVYSTYSKYIQSMFTIVDIF